MKLSRVLSKVLRYRNNVAIKHYYDHFYAGLCNDLGISKNVAVKGEKEWLEKWSGMIIPANPLNYRFWSHFVGNDIRIVPEDICRQVIEPCLNPQAFRKFYADKNSWDLLFGEGIFPKTIIRCMEGVFYTSDYKRLVNFNDSKLYDLLDNEANGGGKFFVKPTRDTNSSQGVSSINTKDGKWFLGKQCETELTIENLWTLTGKNFIIQPFLKQHPYISQFCHSSVNPIRLITYKSVKDDKVHVLDGAMLRIGAEGEENDGTHGNGKFVGIKPDGKMSHEVLDYLGNKTKEFNGVVFSDGYTIPNYQEIKDMAVKVAEKVLPHRLLAFDIMLNEEGKPVVFEFNIDYFSIWLSQFVGYPAFDDFVDEIIDYSKKNINSVKMQLLY